MFDLVLHTSKIVYLKLALRHSIVFILIGLYAQGCVKHLDRSEYLSYIHNPNNGLTRTKTINGITIKCSYHPSDLLISQELINQEGIADLPAIDSLRKIYNHKLYCTLSLSRDGIGIENVIASDRAVLSQVINHLNNDIAKDVYLHILGYSDSTAALGATYARYYGSANHSAVLLAFDIPKKNINKGFTIFYKDAYFGLQPVRFIFQSDDICKLPLLKMNNLN